MRTETKTVLRAINRRFYDRFAAGFDASRGRPWPGWQRVIGCWCPADGDPTRPRAAGSPPAVLDVGCGNGRLGAYLAATLPGAFRYFGVDGCGALLEAAAARLDGIVEAVELRRLDVLDGDLDRRLGDRRFDLVALFGVLHHVPGADSRRDLLRRLGRRLAPGGTLAASIWRLDRTPRIARMTVPWEAYRRPRARRRLEPLDVDDLEAGDRLLSWGGDAEHPRYCHFPGAAGIEDLIAAPGLPLADRFEADGATGRDNLYLVWQDRGRRS